MNNKLEDITQKLLGIISVNIESFKGAYSIRENGSCKELKSTKNINISKKSDKPGLDIRVSSETKGEKMYIPACVTHGDVDDLVYNDFYIEDGADVRIIAGCGVNTSDHGTARHSGIHCFHLGKGSHVTYEENHVGTGEGGGDRTIDPVTEVYLGENSKMEMNTYQIGGVDKADRKTKVFAESGAQLIIKERILTDKEQEAKSDIYVELNGEGSSADIVSHSIAKEHSVQKYYSTIVGNAPCTGHTECDAIIDGDAVIDALPRLYVKNSDAQLVHEAAIGKIASDQILKLRTLGLTKDEAEAEIIKGFLA